MVTAPPYYPDWRVGAGVSNWWSAQAINCGDADAPRHDGSLLVYRCPLWVPARPGGLKRLLHLASFAAFSLPVMLRQVFWRPHVVWVVEPALFCAPAALTVARLSGARAWLHVQDFEVDAAFALGLLRGAFLRRMVAGAERWLMRRFDVVSTISQRMHQRLLDKGVAPAQAVLAPNWVDLSTTAHGGIRQHTEAGAMVGDHDFRAQLGISPGAVVALYSGNMGAKQGLELLADVARLSAHGQQAAVQPATAAPPDIVFVFCGNGVGRAELVRHCAGLPNVHFLDLQPVERLNALLAMADIHLLPQRADAADLVMPSKLTGMLASGRPVVATALDGTELAGVISGKPASLESGANALMTHPCGLVVEPGNARAFADAVQTLTKDGELRFRLGRAGRAYAEAHLDREAVLQRLEARMMAECEPRAAGAGFMTERIARALLGLQMLALLVGTQMPGAWRSAVEQGLHAEFGLSSWAHFVLFAGMAGLEAVQPLSWTPRRILLSALVLALLTEGLQFFAIDRHPRWIDVGIDLAGTFIGLGLVYLSRFYLLRRK